MAIARRAGAAVEAIRARGFVTSDKLDRSPVTEADLAADRIITEALGAARPGEPILSEESSWSAARREARAVWCVDPIDGTEAFIDASMRGYAVQIARLEPRADGAWEPTLGVVYEPNHDVLVAALAGGDVRFEVGGQTRALGAHDAATAGAKGRLVVSSRAPQRLRQAMFRRGYGDAGQLRSVGVKVVHLLAGEAEVYSAAPSLAFWDLAAPQVILEAAGGVVTDMHGRRPRYDFDAGGTHLAEPTLLTLGVAHTMVLADLLSAVRELGWDG